MPRSTTGTASPGSKGPSWPSRPDPCGAGRKKPAKKPVRKAARRPAKKTRQAGKEAARKPVQKAERSDERARHRDSACWKRSGFGCGVSATPTRMQQLLFELDSDPEVMRYLGPFRVPTVEAYRERIRTVWLPYYSPHSTRGFWAFTRRPTTDSWDGVSCGPPPTTSSRPKLVGPARPIWNSAIDCAAPSGAAAWPRKRLLHSCDCALADPSVTCIVAAALVPNRGSTRSHGEDRDGARPRVRDRRL